MGHRLAGTEPLARVEMEALDQTRRPDTKLRWQGREDLQLRRRDDGAQTELGGRPGQPGEEQRLGLFAGHPCQAGPIAIDQAETAVRATLGVDRDARRAQRLDIAMDGPFGHLELGRELGGGQLAACLEEEQERHEAGGAHPVTIRLIHDRTCQVGVVLRSRRSCRRRLDRRSDGRSGTTVGAAPTNRASTSRGPPGPGSLPGSGRHRRPPRHRGHRRSRHR